MNDDIELLKRRFKELYDKAERGGYYTFTDFLGLAEQSALAEVTAKLNRGSIRAFGGAEGAERVMVRFGNAEEIGYEVDFPIVCVSVEPLSQKFADKLTHRDFLGALLNLGIERSTLGDIVIRENVGYVFAEEKIAQFITGELSRVKRTDVKARKTDTLPEGELYRTEYKRIQVQSERLDATVAKVFSLSREDAQTLVKRSLVFVNGKETVSSSYAPKEGDKISVRGHGRFIYKGFDSTSRKGKLNAIVELYV
jgi:RNA-binding protein YlmH